MNQKAQQDDGAKAPGEDETILKRLGPGLITGAADDDPSGIVTYSQAGAQFGLNMLWAVIFTLPLMVAIQSICARIGRVTGHGLASNLNQVFPRWAVGLLVVLLFVANAVNIGADLSAMGAAVKLLAGGNQHVYTIGFAVISLLLQVLVPYHRYVAFLKWLTMALFAYVAVVFTVKIDWAEVALRTVFPELKGVAWVVVVVALFGTTISPYLFFWQSSEEVEEEEAKGEGSLVEHPEDAPKELRRIRWDTLIGMGFSNLIAFFIILTAAVTLHIQGITDIQTSAQAAQALRPIAGELAFLLFSLGVIGTGLLAVPVLAGSVGYAAGEYRGWTCGLEHKPSEAPGFYAVIVAAVVAGLAVDYSGIDPIKALFWSAVTNGVISVPIMAATMVVAGSPKLMGPFVASRLQIAFGWTATIVMGGAVVAMLLIR